MKRCIPHFAITMALVSFAFGQSATQHESQTNESEQEVRKAIEKYRTALKKALWCAFTKTAPLRRAA